MTSLPSDAAGSVSTSSLKRRLLDALRGIEGFEARPSKVAGGTALFYRGQEFAHFHHDHEIDLRLTRPVIRAMGLSHPPQSVHHPARSASSPWIELRFEDAAAVDRVAGLVKVAIERL